MHRDNCTLWRLSSCSLNGVIHALAVDPLFLCELGLDGLSAAAGEKLHNERELYAKGLHSLRNDTRCSSQTCLGKVRQPLPCLPCLAGCSKTRGL